MNSHLEEAQKSIVIRRAHLEVKVRLQSEVNPSSAAP